jgi:hypothetical protein
LRCGGNAAITHPQQLHLKEITMPTTDSNHTTKTSTPHKVPVPEGKCELPTTLPDFPGPVTTPPPAAVQTTTG